MVLFVGVNFNFFQFGQTSSVHVTYKIDLYEKPVIKSKLVVELRNNIYDIVSC